MKDEVTVQQSLLLIYQGFQDFFCSSRNLKLKLLLLKNVKVFKKKKNSSLSNLIPFSKLILKTQAQHNPRYFKVSSIGGSSSFDSFDLIFHLSSSRM